MKTSSKDRLDYFRLMSRRDINFFAAYVGGYRNEPFHRHWHELAGRHDRLILHAPVEHGKSEQMSILRPLWLMGRDPNTRIAIISATSNPQAEKFLQTISRHVIENPRYREVFPHVRPGTPWGQGAISLRRTAFHKDRTVQVTGAFGPINGSRLDLVILDDVLGFENTFTESSRRKVLAWIESEVLGRLVDGGRLIAIGTAWHPGDAMFELARRPGFYHHLDRAVSDGRILWPKPRGKPDVPFGWTEQRIQKRRDELGPLAFARQFLNEPRSDEAARCKEAWVNRCIRSDLKPGEPVHPEEWALFTGVDPAVGRGKSHDLTAIFTIAVNRATNIRRVMGIESGQWALPMILERIIAVQARWSSVVFLESNGAQDYLRQALVERNPGLPVEAHQTGLNKHHEAYGVESVFAEFEQGLWEIPGPDSSPEIQNWISDCLLYHPDSHTGDRLMACWIAREGARERGTYEVKSEDYRLESSSVFSGSSHPWADFPPFDPRDI
ncbi:MAG: hypothetical protein KIT79_08310 [Deltaproteobacteria bacterium]|nr:hypothetical protein [Deltaproteobacteria bacterium]